MVVYVNKVKRMQHGICFLERGKNMNNEKIKKATWLIQQMINDFKYDIRNEEKELAWTENNILVFKESCNVETMRRHATDLKKQLECDNNVLERLIEIRDTLN